MMLDFVCASVQEALRTEAYGVLFLFSSWSEDTDAPEQIVLSKARKFSTDLSGGSANPESLSVCVRWPGKRKSKHRPTKSKAPPAYVTAIRNEFRKMMNSRNANMFGSASPLPWGRKEAGRAPLRPIDSVTELRDTLLRAAPSITLLLSMSSSSSSSSMSSGSSTPVSGSVTYRLRFCMTTTLATFVLPTKLHERMILYDLGLKDPRRVTYWKLRKLFRQSYEMRRVSSVMPDSSGGDAIRTGFEPLVEGKRKKNKTHQIMWDGRTNLVTSRL
uniref:Uncharacterized protein n=1 Tax=Anopheles atroparvus TaxID=41427 RepID=A0A182J2L7_ANOAO